MGERDTGISVSGTGEITGTPDTMTIDLGVSVLADTVQSATSQASAAASALIESLRSNDVPDDSIATTQYSIQPEYDYSNNARTLLGYRVENTVRVKVADVSRSGDVIDHAAAAVGDIVTVNGITFSIEDDAAMVASAREAAWHDAKAKAEQLAQLAGRTLGQVESIVESINPPPAPIELARLRAADSTPIQPGTATVSIGLHVRFSFGE